MNERYLDDEQRIRNDWFKDHIARYRLLTDGDYTIETLTWAKPGTNMYAVHYWYRGGTLVVFGDVGDAVFQWHSSIGTLAGLWELSLDYFAGKCQASEYGQGYKTWSPQKAKEALDYYSKEDIQIRDGLAEHGAYEEIGSQYEWGQWLQDHGYEVFGDICDMYDMGMEVDIRCHAFLVGLQMAFRQITDDERNAPHATPSI